MRHSVSEVKLTSERSIKCVFIKYTFQILEQDKKLTTNVSKDVKNIVKMQIHI